MKALPHQVPASSLPSTGPSLPLKASTAKGPDCPLHWRPHPQAPQNLWWSLPLRFHLVLLLMSASVLGQALGGHRTTPFPGATGAFASLWDALATILPARCPLYVCLFSFLEFRSPWQVTLSQGIISRWLTPCYLTVLWEEQKLSDAGNAPHSTAGLSCCPWKVCSSPPTPCRLWRGETWAHAVFTADPWALGRLPGPTARGECQDPSQSLIHVGDCSYWSSLQPHLLGQWGVPAHPTLPPGLAALGQLSLAPCWKPSSLLSQLEELWGCGGG